jgi:hypothetical protein
MNVLTLVLLLVGCVGTDVAEPHDTSRDTGRDTGTDTDTGEDTDTDTPKDRVALGSAADGAFTVEAWADEAPHVGHNRVGYRVLDGTGAPVDGLTVTHAPWMEMEDVGHACPYTVPSPAGGGWYESEVVFLMGGAWTDTVTVSDGATSSNHTFAVEVEETHFGQMVTAGDASWFVAFDLAAEPATGANPFVLTVHAMQDAATFPEVPDLQVVVEPSMPRMGHGSEGNVNPVYVGAGVYSGTVVFSMGGPWEVLFTLSGGDGTEVEVVFEVEV